MPQMAPINWLILIMYTLGIFMIFNLLNYFIFFNFMSKKKMLIKSSSINWKW